MDGMMEGCSASGGDCVMKTGRAKMNGRIEAATKTVIRPSRQGMIVRILMGLLIFGCAFLSTPGWSHAGLEDDVRGLREDMGQVKKDLAEIKTLLQSAIKRPAPQKSTGTVGFTGRPMLGNPDAPVTIVEFSDYQCPYCRRYSLTVFPTLKRDYIDTGKVRYVFRDFPLTNIHAQAEKAHESAHCAREVQKYWEMHDVLFTKQKELAVPSLKQYAATLGLDPEIFAACLDSGKYQAEIRKDITDGTAAGIRGTPSFFIGKSGSGDSITGTIIRGAQPLANFQTLIDRLLSKPAPKAHAAPPDANPPSVPTP